MIPNAEDCLALHVKYGSGERVVSHCRTVARVSISLADAISTKGRKVDKRAILAGAMLHDIGRSRIQTVAHGYIGAGILEGEGVDGVVVEIVRRHVGAGISTKEAKALGFPEGDYVPSTLEQKIVCFADKMVSSDSVRPLEEEVRRFERKGHDVQPLLSLKRDLQEAVGDDPERIVLTLD